MPGLQIRKPNLKSYKALRERVRERITLGRQKMEAERVEAYHDTGRMIVEHCDAHSEKPKYGNRVVENLSADLGISRGLLFDIVLFAKIYPKVYARRQLTWADYRHLIHIQDPEERKRLEGKIIRNQLSTRQLEHQIPKKNPPRRSSNQKNLLKPILGQLGTYRVVDAKEAGVFIPSPAPSSKRRGKKMEERTLFFDHGFRIYRRLSGTESEGVKAGDLVEFKNGSSTKSFEDDETRGQEPDPSAVVSAPFSRLIKSSRTEKDRFFYSAAVEKVVDGDTLWAAVDIGFSEIARQKLRLRGIDAPELLEPGGAEAFRFLKLILPPATSILLHTSASPNHDRFVADVYISVSESTKKILERIQAKRKIDPAKLKACLATIETKEYYFLNNLMLVLEFAGRFEE